MIDGEKVGPGLRLVPVVNRVPLLTERGGHASLRERLPGVGTDLEDDVGVLFHLRPRLRVAGGVVHEAIAKLRDVHVAVQNLKRVPAHHPALVRRLEQVGAVHEVDVVVPRRVVPVLHVVLALVHRGHDPGHAVVHVPGDGRREIKIDETPHAIPRRLGQVLPALAKIRGVHQVEGEVLGVRFEVSLHEHQEVIRELGVHLEERVDEADAVGGIGEAVRGVRAHDTAWLDPVGAEVFGPPVLAFEALYDDVRVRVVLAGGD